MLVRFPRWLHAVLIGLIVLGVVFRFVNLNHKVYAHDEVLTTLRAAGYTQRGVEVALFQNHSLPVAELQAYQQIQPNSTALDMVRSLASEAPQQPPLYLWLTREWMRWLDTPLKTAFKSSLTTQRSLPALISVLALPAMYGLAWELFATPAIALLAATLLAISPLDVLFAQMARPYSLLTLMVIVSSYGLLLALRQLQAATKLSRKAMKSQQVWWAWGSYSAAVAIGLYTHPLFVFTVLGHGVYVGALWYCLPRVRRSPVGRWFAGSVGVALALYSPWVVVMVVNRQAALAAMDWSALNAGFGSLAKFWTLSLTALVFDLNSAPDTTWIWAMQIAIVLLIGLSLYMVCQHTPPSTWLLIVTAIAVPCLLLVLPGLFLDSQRSVVSRALITTYPAVQLAMAYFLGTQLGIKTLYSGRSPNPIIPYSPRRFYPEAFTRVRTWFWRGVVALLVVGSLSSLTTSALSNSWWNCDLSYFNAQTANLIHTKSVAIVVSDRGYNGTNTGDLISLSYRLEQPVELLLLKDADFAATETFQTALQGQQAISFRPSQALQQQLDQIYSARSSLLEGEQVYGIASP